jgi:D-hydroxyproline dehydrogenase subunit gamma
MFSYLESNQVDLVIINIDGVDVEVPHDTTVASAILYQSTKNYRTTLISTSTRAPYCMIGVCFDCLVEINGVSDQQACLIRVKPGMKICRQNNSRQIA